MTKESNNHKEKSLERLELSASPKLRITKKLKQQIDYLHAAEPGKEWSGELITSERGNLNDLDKWEITAEEMYLVDVGTGASTEYEVDKGAFKPVDIVAMYDKYPGLLDGTLKNHNIHSHHMLGSFMSGTDWENLETRAKVSNYFLMLVVDCKGKYVAKMAFVAKEEASKGSKLSLVNNQDGFKSIPLEADKDREVLVVMDCDIIFEEETDRDFVERYEYVKEAKEKDEEEKRKSRFNNDPKEYKRRLHEYSPQSKLPFEDYDIWGDPKKDKKISEMTDKDWKEFDSKTTPKWNYGDVIQLLNSMLENTYCLGDVKDPIKKLEKEDRDNPRVDEKEEWAGEFSTVLGYHFDSLFPGKDVDDYIAFLEKMKEYLKPYAVRIGIVKEILNEVDDEITLNKSMYSYGY